MIRLLSRNEKKKTVHIMGGLGNVLFQLNFAHRLKEHGYEVKINSYMLRNTMLNAKILRFTNHGTYDDLIKIKVLDDFDVSDRFSWASILAWISKFTGLQFYGVKYFGHNTPMLGRISAVDLFGYFHLNNEISDEFVNNLNSKLSSYIHRSESKYLTKILRGIDDSVVVHIRGGDYKNNPAFRLDVGYYATALRGSEKCYVVTNDKLFAFDLLSKINVPFYILETKSAIDDFVVLAKARNKVLANSTFSWWASELGDKSSIVTQSDPFFFHINWTPLTKINRYGLNFDEYS